jgi:IclR family transcriptional regulator, KDG regulon repressor
MKNDTTIQSIDRAVTLLLLFTRSRPKLGITEISQDLGLAKGTVHGLVRTLSRAGFLQQDPESRKYRLGLKIYELGMILAGTLDINEKSLAPTSQLANRTGLTAKIAIWDGNSALLVLQIDPRAHSLFTQQIGPSIPGYCSAVGKAILAQLEPEELDAYLDRTPLVPYTSKTITDRTELLEDLGETRQRGYSVDREETVLGFDCIGAPIFGRGGEIGGAISLSGSAEQIFPKQKEKTEALTKQLLVTAAEISRSLGHWGKAIGTRKPERPLKGT